MSRKTVHRLCAACDETETKGVRACLKGRDTHQPFKASGSYYAATRKRSFILLRINAPRLDASVRHSSPPRRLRWCTYRHYRRRLRYSHPWWRQLDEPDLILPMVRNETSNIVGLKRYFIFATTA